MPARKKGVHIDGKPFTDPNQPSWATVNRRNPIIRRTVEVKLRLPPEVLDLVNEAAAAFGNNKRNGWLSRAALDFVKAQGIEVSPEVDEQVKVFDLSDLPKLAEPIDEFDRFDPE